MDNPTWKATSARSAWNKKEKPPILSEFRNTRRKTPNSADGYQVDARIVERKDDEGHVRRTPVYTYKDTAGKGFTDRSSTGDGREFEVGDTIPIRYLKNSPHQSRIDYFSHHWLLPIFMAIFSIVVGALGFGLRWWREREQQWANNKGADQPAAAAESKAE